MRRVSKQLLKQQLSKAEKRLLKNCEWKAYTDGKGFMAIFFGAGGIWEGHWKSTANAFYSLTACREAIKIFFKETGAEYLFGCTDCRNIKALKMAKCLGFTPLGFREVQGIICLISRKEKL